MVSYYHKVIGNLKKGDIAKSSDINHIQLHISDALKTLLSELHDNESYVLGHDEVYKNSFILKAAPKTLGRYLDSYNFDDETKEENAKCVNINRYSVKQPIIKTKTSLYSIIAKFKNTSNKNITVTCRIEDEDGAPLRTNYITLAPNTTFSNYEIVFDLDFYPAPPNLDYKDLKERDGKDLPSDTKEESFDEGFEEEHKDESYHPFFTAGLSKLFFVVERTELNETSLKENENDEVSFDPENSLGLYYLEGSPFPDKNIYAEISKGTIYETTDWNICYQDVYANGDTYLCEGGSAIIDGERVDCLDTHISVEGGSSYGNVLTQIYLGNDGHLRFSNKKTSLSLNIEDFEQDISNPLPPNYLPIALILTYSNTLYGTIKEPLILQDYDYGQRPPSHHERLRRLEKQMDWSNDIALPGRIEYSINDGEWIDKEEKNLLGLLPNTNSEGENVDSTSENNIFLTTDEKGNVVVKISNAVTEELPITLKEKLKDDDGKAIKLEDTDVLNVSSFSKLENIVHDSKKGTLSLDIDKTKEKKSIATTSKEAKQTEFNPWDDSASNRPSGKNYQKNEREYKVVSGKNGENDRESFYPGMTFYTSTNYNMKKLTIPIHKFENCSAVKFFIYKRQESNNKKNRVWLQKCYSSKQFSLKKAKVKGKYQYMDDGFTMNFGKGGLSLPKGQYVIIALPIPKSGTGSLFVETYKPKNSKDFCIKYRGSANAAHFRLVDRYQEIWYNSASAVVDEENYYTKGTATSKTLTWDEDGLERIVSVKPIVGKNLTTSTDKKQSYEIQVNTGGNWVTVKPDEDNKISSGGAKTFKWRITFKSDGKGTPKLAYNSKNEYAIKFILTRQKPGDFEKSSEVDTINKNMCITSVPIDGDDVLRKYIGDPNFGLEHSRFQGYEFARVWADENINKSLLIDIQASDKNIKYVQEAEGKKEEELYTPLWSLHYCDLTLDDFDKINVNYSHYDEDLEYDENNLRLKLDSEHSYNDDDIQISVDFKKTPNDIDDSEDEQLSFVSSTVEENQLFLKKTFANPIDLTKYTGLKFRFKTGGTESTTGLLKGVGIYISSIETNKNTIPSDLNKPEDVAETLYDTDIIPNIIDPDTSSYSHYEGKIIEIKHDLTPDDGDNTYQTGYYKYVKQYDDKQEKFIYKLVQVHDLRTFNLYKLNDIVFTGEEEYFDVRIEMDQNSNNLKYVKEIGIITLNDEKTSDGESVYSVKQTSTVSKLTAEAKENNTIKITLKDNDNNPIANGKIIYNETNDDTNVTNANGIKEFSNLQDTGEATFVFTGGKTSTGDDAPTYSASMIKVSYDFTKEEDKITIKEDTFKVFNGISLELDSLRGIREDTLTIYDPDEEKGPIFSTADEGRAVVYGVKTVLDKDTYLTTLANDTDNNISKVTETSPKTTQICIKRNSEQLKGANTLVYVNNPFNGGTSGYKHIGIQLAADCYIPKDSLKVNICSEKNGENPIISVNIPTLNTIFYPRTGDGTINLSQIFKRFDIDDEQIKSISITCTPYFQSFMNETLTTDKPTVNLFVGKIVLYKAKTIPIYHNKMRYKFYNTTNGEIDHEGAQKAKENSFSIRKIGAVLDYD